MAFFKLFFTAAASSALLVAGFLSATDDAPVAIKESMDQQILGSSMASKLLKSSVGNLFSSIDFNYSHSHSSHDSSTSHEKEKSLLLHMTMTISSGPIMPDGYTIDVTPFAISPCGKKFSGDTMNISLSNISAISQPLNPVYIPDLVEGTYTVGYSVSLGNNSTPVTFIGESDFNAVILTKGVFGLSKQTISSDFLAFQFSNLKTPSDELKVTANCQLLTPRSCHICQKRLEENVNINMNLLYSRTSGFEAPSTTFKFTAFAIAPNGKVYKGAPISLILTDLQDFIPIPLSTVTVPHPIKGSYFVGYEFSPISGPPADANITYDFWGSINDNPVDGISEFIIFPKLQLPLGALQTPDDLFRVTGNFIIDAN